MGLEGMKRKDRHKQLKRAVQGVEKQAGEIDEAEEHALRGLAQACHTPYNWGLTEIQTLGAAANSNGVRGDEAEGAPAFEFEDLPIAAEGQNDNDDTED